MKWLVQGVKQVQFFCDDLGKRISDITGDCNETAYLYQRLSIAIQRGSTSCFIDSFENSDITDLGT